jgi:hypothetical protein
MFVLMTKQLENATMLSMQFIFSIQNTQQQPLILYVSFALIRFTGYFKDLTFKKFGSQFASNVREPDSQRLFAFRQTWSN